MEKFISDHGNIDPDLKSFPRLIEAKAENLPPSLLSLLLISDRHPGLENT